MPPLVPALLILAAVAGWNGSDDFRGTTLNWCNWESASVDATVAQNEELILSTRGDRSYSTASVRTQYVLSSDFDFSVDYKLGSGWDAPIVPAGSNPRIDVSLSLLVDGGTSRLVVIRSKDPFGEAINLYTTVPGLESHNGFLVATSNRSGAFRLIRTGAALEIRHQDGTGWKTLKTLDGLSVPVHVQLGALAINANNAFIASFDNFNLLSGTTSSRAWARPDAFRSRSDLRLGGVVSDFMAHRTWGQDWQTNHPLDALRANGVEWVRVGVLTTSSTTLSSTPSSQWRALGWRDEYWSSFEFAAEILRQARDRGYRLNVFFYLSDRAAHAGQQFAPAAWANLSVEQLAAELERYTFETASRFRALGLPIEIYDLGNEIDFGILGFRPGERVPLPPGTDIVRDLGWMRNNIWSVEARLLAGAARGVRRADPAAKIVLHIAGVGIGEGNAWPLAFFKTMIDAGVDFDYAGLSHPYAAFPWNLEQYSTDCWFQKLDDLVNGIAALGKKTIISEAAYPFRPDGEKASPMREFPFSAAGQGGWTRAQLRFASNSENIVGWFWFYPDYYPGVGQNTPLELQYSGLFSSEFNAVPALAEFRANLAELTASATVEASDPLAVAFRSTLSGAAAQSYRWDFGDGSASTEANPRHRYAAAGTYRWTVVAETSVGSVSAEGTVRVSAGRSRRARR